MAVLLAVAAAACVALPGLAADPDALRDRIAGAQAREESLSAQVARLGGLAARTQRQLSALERRLAEVQADLARDEAELGRVRADLEAERRRLARLRARLDEVRRVLAGRLVTRYKASDVDALSVVLGAHSFSDLLERANFLRRIQRADENILVVVRDARTEAARETKRLAAAEARQQRIVEGLRARRDAVATMRAAVASRRAMLERIRAARAAALQAVRGDRKRLQSRLREVEAAIAKAAAAPVAAAPSGGGPGPGGPWAIPWEIVQCESGGQNLPPNWAGASGYYQIIPETWARSGGRGPHAYLRPKAEQDAVAARIWANDGPQAWDCTAIVRG